MVFIPLQWPLKLISVTEPYGTNTVMCTTCSTTIVCTTQLYLSRTCHSEVTKSIWIYYASELLYLKHTRAHTIWLEISSLISRPTGVLINLLMKILGHPFKANNYELYFQLQFKMHKPHRKIVGPLASYHPIFPLKDLSIVTTKLKWALLHVTKCSLMQTDAILTSNYADLRAGLATICHSPGMTPESGITDASQWPIAAIFILMAELEWKKYSATISAAENLASNQTGYIK